MGNIKDSDFSLVNILEKEGFTSETKERALKADILFVPEFDFRSKGVRGFYGEVSGLLKHMRKAPGISGIELLENQGEEKFLDLRCSDIWMPTIFIAKEAFFQGVVGVVSSYVYDKLKGSMSSGSKAHLKLYSKTKTGKAKEFDYNGPAEALPKILKGINAAEFFEG